MKFRRSLGLLAGFLLLNGNAVLAQEVETTTEVAPSTTQVVTTQVTEKAEITTAEATTQTQEVTTETSTTEAPKYTGWVQTSDGTWYFYNDDHTMLTSNWKGDYYLEADGKMATSKWVDNYKYYVDASGKWVPGKVKKSGWVKEGGYWYYYLEGEQLLRNNWKGNYYLGSDGKMATENWVDDHKYYVDKNGAWLPNPSSKGNQKEILLDLARGYIGVEQFDSRHNTMVSIYNSGKSSYSGYRVSTYDDWCDIFVSTMYQQSGLIDLIDKEAYVPYHIRLMKNKGIWVGNSGPQPGDVITFDWNLDGVADHIAIVEKVEGDKVITIEGNTSDRNYDESKVVRKSHKLSARYIIGYGRPQYQ